MHGRRHASAEETPLRKLPYLSWNNQINNANYMKNLKKKENYSIQVVTRTKVWPNQAAKFVSAPPKNISN